MSGSAAATAASNSYDISFAQLMIRHHKAAEVVAIDAIRKRRG